MTTHGPTTFSLAERLAAADAVLRVDAVELAEVTTDEFAETHRELGHFVLRVRETLSGEAVESLRIVVARERDGSWPLPTNGRFVALVQAGGKEGDWTLVHNSAFALARNAIWFNPGAGCGAANGEDERVSLKELERTIAEMSSRREAFAKTLKEQEPGSADDRWYVGEMEMPDQSLAPWLNAGREYGGSPGHPDDVSSKSRRSKPE